MAKRMKSEQAETAPIIHNHVPSQAATIFAISIVGAIVLVVLYFWLSATIEEALGVDGDYVLVGLLVTPLFVYVCLYGFSRIWNYFAAENHQRKMELIRERRETLAIEHKFYSGLAARTREVTPELKRRNELIIAAVHAGLNGEAFGKRPAGKIILSGDTAPVGKDSKPVDDGFAWMVENGVAQQMANGHYRLVSGTTLSHVEALLNVPITLKS